ncbi:metal ABC transporter ATP-binding protein [Bacillus solimangrovi]|nr:metal ABC transporter ATP-binding protein [Bacillus solimangrovi]
MSKPVLNIEHLYFKYEKQDVLEDITLKMPKGAFLGLVGPNGSGKSTLIKLILGLQKSRKGKIELFGTPIQKFKDWDKVGFVSQKANSFNTGFPATVFEVVSMGLVSKLGFFRFMRKQEKDKIYEAIEAVGMLEYASKNIGELSGGQQQRVFIARALVSEPELLILDEPTVGVDAKNVNVFYGMLEELNRKKGISLLLITHDIGTITDKVTHVACLNRHLHFHGETEDFEKLGDENMSQIYGHSLQVLTHNHGGHAHD